MAKRQIATARKRGHIRRMAEDVKTLREAGQAIDGLRREFGYFKWYLGGLAAVFAAGFALLYSAHGETSKQLSDISRVLGRIEGRLEAAEKRAGNAAPRTQNFDMRQDGAVQMNQGK